MKPQAWLAPLTPLYAAAISAKNAAYDRGWIRQKRLSGLVVSIGNLSTGGGGKTPFAIALARLLTEAGAAVDVLSRGYGRQSETVERVDASESSTSEQFGDEPLLIAREARVPVYVGPQRYQAGLLAEKEKVRLHLLDDGFQHRQLGRDLDIVLLHRDDLQTRLLPAGHLREPLSSLRRADVVVLREEDGALETVIRRYLQPDTSVWHVRRQVKPVPTAQPALALCGIARPQEFFAELRALGVNLVETMAFPDHHRFSAAELRALGERCKAAGATRILTTAKDLTRLSQGALETLRQYAPIEVASLDVALVEPGEVLSRLGSLRPRGQRHAKNHDGAVRK
jgi:tetraacyldisaccharide 4'-kinase